MSDSDDTEVLLLIPPDLFIVPSSDSEDNLDSCTRQQSKSGVVSELIDHVQTLESRILAIESRDSPNNSLNLSRRVSLDSAMSCRQTIPKTKYSVSQNSSLQSPPSKHFHCLSLPSTPNIHQKSNYTNEKHHHLNSKGSHQCHEGNSSLLNKHDHLKSFSESFYLRDGLKITSALHAGTQLSGNHSLILPALSVCENNISHDTFKHPSTGHCSSDCNYIKNMNLPEVNKLLKEIQSNDKNKRSENQYSNGNPLKIDTGTLGKQKVFEMKDSDECINSEMDQEQKPISNNHNTLLGFMNSSNYRKKKNLLDTSLLDSSFSSFDTERFMTEFKTWNPNPFHDPDCSRISKDNMKNCGDSEKNGFPIIGNFQHKEAGKENNYQQQHADDKKHPDGSLAETAESTSVSVGDSNCLLKNSNINVNSNESSDKRPQCLLTLSDIWNPDSTRPEEEQLRLKLEEEKFRREHCEQLIQELQKKLLEYQEKIAVAIRVDSEKNSFILQAQISWKIMKQKLYEVEAERESLQKVLKEIGEKHQLETVEYQKQIVKYKEELSKTLNLATGYKEKSDAFVKEKVELLRNHTDELQNYKILVQQAENRYEEMQNECQKLLEKNKKIDETMRNVQQDLNTELMKSSEVKVELSVIHQALDTCEAELLILRQEKENLQLKLKEENNRNSILEQGKNSLAIAMEDAKKSEKLATNEVKSLIEQQEKLRSELRDVYQRQVDEVVKTKLHEFQAQLDSAEAVFQNEVETKQRAIAECAARKIKNVMDKHQLEIHLVEEKHKEEKKLFELKVAQAVQKSTILEAQLNSYRKSKSQLVEQLYSMLQKQWQQALVIISGSHGESMSSFQKISVDKLFDFSNEENLELIPEHCSTLCTDTMKSGMPKNIHVKSLQAQDVHDDSLITLTLNDDTPLSSKKESKSDLKKYIKMILDMQQKDDNQKSKMVNDHASQKEMPHRQSFGGSGSMVNEGNSKWQPISEISIHDTSEYLSPPLKCAFKSDNTKEKPPWK